MEAAVKLKTSEEWYAAGPKDYVIYDPDGWDRANYQFSFHEEKIAFEEFERRLMRSTVVAKKLAP